MFNTANLPPQARPVGEIVDMTIINAIPQQPVTSAIEVQQYIAGRILANKFGLYDVADALRSYQENILESRLSKMKKWFS